MKNFQLELKDQFYLVPLLPGWSLLNEVLLVLLVILRVIK